ncbi:hypothetical protein HS1genome_0481 [Sulfodiicoccus acidiphilus]|uniref:Major facilitator superfamily (MFS) profile domain-containing protein n=2 Tax=Sulfodiicoccus acidiphilus TaxID=1670455 RepID=A0A348B1P0_9CREN|nr:hypothetical protein HS1genome_0481 [Sulfodiicoccus acidiphilus]GGU05094.1 hypothetical protein GCM10007116_22030 [Sulfodiicoccus acidiphilus]
MQLPSAFLSTKLGMKRTMGLGLVIMGLGNVVVSRAGNFPQLLVAYAIVGIGASMFFSSGGGMLAFLNSRASTVLGVYNALFSVGGILAFAYGEVELRLGWRFPVAVLGLVTLALGLVTLTSSLPNPMGKWSTIRDARVLLLGLATSGVWGAYFAVGNLFPTFAFHFDDVSLEYASSLSSLLLVSAALGGAIAFVGDRVRGLLALIVPSVLSLASLALLYLNLAVGLFLVGMFNELAITVMYARAATVVGYTNASISLAEVNSLNMLCGIYLSAVAPLFGFEMWIAMALLGLIPLSLLALYSLVSRNTAGRNFR